MIATLDTKLIVAASRRCRLRYVKGAHLRYGKKSNVITMANASFKVRTIGKVLRSLGCKSVAAGHTASIPAATKVFFARCPAIEKSLSVTKRITLKAFRGQKHFKGFKKL